MIEDLRGFGNLAKLLEAAARQRIPLSNPDQNSIFRWARQTLMTHLVGRLTHPSTSELKTEELRVKVKQERRDNAIKEAEEKFMLLESISTDTINRIETLSEALAIDEELQEMEDISDLSNIIYSPSK